MIRFSPLRPRLLAAALLAGALAATGLAPDHAGAWGGDIHRLLNRAASEDLPPAFQPFSQWSGRLVTLSTAADSRKRWDDDESIRHYIDIDGYPEFFSGTLPHTWENILAAYGRSRVEDNGILPWAIEDSYDELVYLFVVRDWDEAVEVAADIGHYVGDLHNPLHLTVNFDGQYTNQRGVHSRYESEMTGRHLDGLRPAAGMASQVPNPLETVFDWIEAQYAGLELVLAADHAARAEAGTYESEAYYDALWKRVGVETQEWMTEASLRIASLWYSAWLEAGSPPLPGSTPVASLLEFRAAASPGVIELSWSVRDDGPLRFQVQRREGEDMFVRIPGAVVANEGPSHPAGFTWRDEDVRAGARYEYRLEAQLRDGTWETWDRAAGAQAVGGSPVTVRLAGPNPLRGSDPIGVTVDLPGPEHVSVTLHDVAGRLVDVLQDGRWETGRHTAVLASGPGRLRAGVYFLAVRTPSFTSTARVVLLD